MQPVEPERRTGVRLRRRRPNRPRTEILRADRLRLARLLRRIDGEAERHARCARPLRTRVVAPEVHADPESDRGLDVVVHDDRRRKLEKGTPQSNELLCRRTLPSELHDRGTVGDRSARRLEVPDESVQLHVASWRTSTGPSPAPRPTRP
jgi:hypothetical protein